MKTGFDSDQYKSPARGHTVCLHPPTGRLFPLRLAGGVPPCGHRTTTLGVVYGLRQSVFRPDASSHLSFEIPSLLPLGHDYPANHTRSVQHTSNTASMRTSSQGMGLARHSTRTLLE